MSNLDNQSTVDLATFAIDLLKARALVFDEEVCYRDGVKPRFIVG